MKGKTETTYERSIRERLGNFITIWYPNIPKPYGLCVIREVLEQYCAWERFIKNYHQVDKQDGHIQVFEYIMRTQDVKNLLEWAFIWGNTPEGSEYWKSLHIKIKERLQQKEEEGINLNKPYKGLSKIETKKFNIKPQVNHDTRPTRQFTQGEWGDMTENDIFSLLSGATQQFISSMYHIGRNMYQNEVKITVPLTKTTIRNISKLN